MSRRGATAFSRLCLQASMRRRTMVAMAIFDAIEQGRVDEVAEYISRGGDPNATAGSRSTLLEVAAACGELEIVRGLLAAGADPDRYGSGESGSALALALENGQGDVCRVLVAAGASVNIQLEGGMTALMGVANSPDEDCGLLKTFLEAGADPRARSDGDIALSFAVYRGHRNICRELARLVSDTDRAALIEWVQLQGERHLLAHQQAEIREILARAGP